MYTQHFMRLSMNRRKYEWKYTFEWSKLTGEKKRRRNYYEATRTDMFANNQHTNRQNRFAPLFSQQSKTLVSIQREKKPSLYYFFSLHNKLTFLEKKSNRTDAFLIWAQFFQHFSALLFIFLALGIPKKSEVLSYRPSERRKKKTVTSCGYLVCIKVEEICWI